MELADQLTLKNGDRVSHDPVGPGDRDRLGRSSDGGPDGKSVVGKVSTTEDKLEVATATAVVTTPLPQVAALQNASEQKSYDCSNPAGLNCGPDTSTSVWQRLAATRTGKATLYFNQIYATATVDGQSSPTADAVRGVQPRELQHSRDAQLG